MTPYVKIDPFAFERTDVSLSPAMAEVFSKFGKAQVIACRTKAEAAAYDEAYRARQAAGLAANEAKAEQDSWIAENHRQGFALVAPACVRNGWSFFAQARSGRRGSILVKQAGRSRKGLSWKEFQTRLPTLDEVAWWAESDRRANLALISGPVSGDAVFFDMDLGDPLKCETAQRIADEIFGTTPFRRVGRAPRIVLVYRSDPSDPIRANRSYRVEGIDGEGADMAIEVMVRGKPITAYGAHHKTGRHFQWVGACSPATHGPEHAPRITQAQLEAFLSACDTAGVVIPSLRNAVSSGERGHIDPSLVTATGFVRPGMNQAMAGVTWDDQGRVTGGREMFLHRRAFLYVVKNPGMALTDKGCYALAGLLADECESTWAPGATKFRTQQELVRGCRERIDSAAAKLKRGEIETRGILRDEQTGKISASVRSPIAFERAESDDLSWLPKERLVLPDDVKVTAADPVAAKARALLSDADRGVQALHVAGDITGLMRSFVAEVRADRKAGKDASVLPVHVLRGPTGSGKSTTAVAVVTNDLMEHGPIGGAMMFLQPSYDNIAENVERFQRSKRGATAVFRKNAEVSAKDLPHGTKYLILEGKERGGCLREAEQRILSKAGISTAGLCKASVQDLYGETEEILCPHYHTCPVIAARRKIPEAEVIFAPSVFMTSPNLPAGLEAHVAGVIADERTWTEVMRWDKFPTATLDLLRAPPRAYKRDKGATGDDLLVSRMRAASIAAAAIRKGRDPAAALFADPLGETMVEDAIKVVGRAQEAGRKLRPDMKIADIKALAERPTGGCLREEWRFWKIVAERLAWLKADALYLSLNGGVDDGSPKLARGERDMRIQSLDGGQTIRISWRADVNFCEKPVLLLDASADEALVSKCWGGRPVSVTHIDAKLNLRTVLVADRTWATSAFRMDLAGDSKKARRVVANVIATAHDAITSAATLYGHGRVVVGAPKSVRQELMLAWAEPANIDWMHYGAVRGLDFARQHLVALSLGRHEFPVRVIDGLVGACTYDDPEPEWPVDRWGDGYQHHPDGSYVLDKHGHEVEIRTPVVTRTYPMRNGADVSVTVSQYEGPWAACIQCQFREEELAQFAGRLRPVYRLGEAPLWIAGSRVLPEGFVIDDVVSLADLADPTRLGKVFDALRRTGVADASVFEDRASDSVMKKPSAAVLHELGLDGRDVSGRTSKGMYSARVTVDGETVERQFPAYLVGEDLDYGGPVYAAYRAAGREAEDVEIIALGADRANGFTRPETGDKVVAEIGGRRERADAELVAREAVEERFARIQATIAPTLTEPWIVPGGDMPVQIILQVHPIMQPGETAEVITLPVGEPESDGDPLLEEEPGEEAA